MTLLNRELAVDVLAPEPSKALPTAPYETGVQPESGAISEVDPATLRDASEHTLKAATAFADNLLDRYNLELNKLKNRHDQVVASFGPRYNLARGLDEVTHSLLIHFDRNVAAAIEVRRDYGRVADDIELMVDIRNELQARLEPVEIDRASVEAKANACQRQIFSLQRSIDEERGPTPRGAEFPSTDMDEAADDGTEENQTHSQYPEQAPSEPETEAELQLAALHASYERLTATHGELSQRAAQLAAKIAEKDRVIAMHRGFQNDRELRLDLFKDQLVPRYLEMVTTLRRTASFVHSDLVSLRQQDEAPEQAVREVQEHTKALAALQFAELDSVNILSKEKIAEREDRMYSVKGPVYTYIPGLSEQDPELMQAFTSSIAAIRETRQHKMQTYGKYPFEYSGLEDDYTAQYEALREGRTIERDEFRDGAEIAKQNLASAVSEYDTVCQEVARLESIGRIFERQMARLVPEFIELNQQAALVGDTHEDIRNQRADVDERLQVLRAAIANMSSQAKVALAEQRQRQAIELAKTPPADEQSWDDVGRILGDSSYFDPIPQQLDSKDLHALGFRARSHDMALLEDDEQTTKTTLAQLGKTMVLSLAIRDELRDELADVSLEIHEARQFFDEYSTHTRAETDSAKVDADLKRRLAERWLNNHHLWTAFLQDWTKEIEAPAQPTTPAEFRQPVPLGSTPQSALRRLLGRILPAKPKIINQLQGGVQ